MSKSEAIRLVWEWIAIQMDHGLMAHNVPYLVIAKYGDEVPAKVELQLEQAWEHVRNRVAKMAGEA